MAEQNQNTGSSGGSSGGTSGGSSSTAGANTAVETHGDHDRVAMLSLKADGTPDQNSPEFIGDPKETEKATTEQFVQQAVSAKDTELREQTGDRGTTVEDAQQDPTVAKLKKEHDAVAKKATSAAKQAVKSLSDKG